MHRRDPIVICSVLAHDVAGIAGAVAAAPRGCALVEIRADCLTPSEIRKAIAACRRPLIVTIRSRSEGGRFEGTEEERRRGLVAALEAGADLVDVAAGSAAEELAEGSWAERVILSHHGAGCGEGELIGVYRSMAESRAGRLKIVAAAASVAGMASIRETLRRASREGRTLACFAAGRPGALSRVLAPSWGSWATYGALERGGETAEGQFPAGELLEIHDVLGIGPQTRHFVLVGAEAFGSPSPAMHRSGYLEHGIDARYLPLELESVDEFLSLAGQAPLLGIDGFAVTMPLKESVAQHCRLADPVAQAAGAVNTVLAAGDALLGFNTDGPAAVGLIADRLDPRNATAAIVGAGGTARAIGAALRRAGARVTLFSRGRARAERAARELGVDWRALDALPGFDWSLLVNATPLGRAGETVLPAAALRGRLVLDAAYAATPTPLMRDARRRGLAAIDGMQLLAAQAALQFERLTGVPARAGSMAAAGMQWLSGRQP